MKKTLLALLCCIMTLACILSFAACSNNKPNTDQTPTDTSKATEKDTSDSTDNATNPPEDETDPSEDATDPIPTECNHSAKVWVDEVKASCTVDGTVGHYSCPDCDKKLDANGTELTDLTIKASHAPASEWSYADGKHYHACANCDEHLDEAACSGGEATCATLAVCEVCKNSYGELSAHVFKTKYSEDNHWQECACGEKKEVTVHTHEVKEVVKNTCTEGGYTVYACACGHTYNDDETDPADHTYEQTWTTDASGHWHKASCGCENEKADYAPHEYTSVVTTDPTCVAKGYTTYTCECGYYYVGNYVPANGHSVTNWVKDASKTVLFDESNCEYTVHYDGVCGSCHETVGKNEQESLHSWFERVTKTATCAEAGEKSTFCASETCKYHTVAKSVVPYTDSEAHVWVEDTAKSTSSMTAYKCDVKGCSATKLSPKNNGNTADLTGDTLKDVSEIEMPDVTIGLDQGIKDNFKDQNVSISAGTLTDEEKKNAINGSNLSDEQKELLGDGEIYDFTLTTTEQVSQLGGTATIRIPYTLGAGENPQCIIVWYISNGELSPIEATYSEDANGNGFVTFQTTHFSYYTVGKVDPAEICKHLGKHDENNLHVVAPTCTMGGYTICLRCGEQVEGSAVPATGHVINMEIIREATCVEHGLVRYSCANCDLTYEVAMAATGHYYMVAGQTSATCKVAGSTTYDCAHCDSTYTVTTPMLKHAWHINVIEPTCVTNGYTEKSCTQCGEVVQSAYVAATGHTASATWYRDAEAHYHVCLTCGEKLDSEAHKPGAAATEQSAQLCTVCSYTIAPPIAHVHSLTKVEAVNATCTESGNIEYYVCACGKWFADAEAKTAIEDHVQVIVDAKGHTTTTTPYVEPTCENVGYTAGVWCEACQTYLRGHIEVSAYGHDYHQIYQAPTCTEKGSISYVCNHCGDKEGMPTETLDALGHNLTSVITAPTCTEGGYTTVICSRCAYSEKTDLTAALGHSYASAFLSDENGHWHACIRCDETTNLEAHTPDYPEATTQHGITCVQCNYVIAEVLEHTHAPAKSVAEKYPTCTMPGNIAYYVCSCGDWYADAACTLKISDRSSVILPATNHTPEYVGEQKPTCEEGGYTAGIYCDKCQTWISGHELLSALDHAWSEAFGSDKNGHWHECDRCDKTSKVEAHAYDTVTVAPTCEAKGYTTYTCTLCGYSYVGDETEALGHSWSKWTEGGDGTHSRVCGNDASHKQTEKCVYVSEVIAPTCTTEGYTKYTCKTCNYSYVDQKTNASEHAWGAWTHNEDGTHSRVCANDKTHVESAKCDYKSVVTAPTCEEKGYTTYTCTVCGHSYIGDETDALTHNFGDWKSNANGTHIRVCKNDASHIETKDCEYESTVIAPTCTTGGYTRYICKLCGHSYDDNFTQPKDHAWSEWKSNEDGSHTRVCGNDASHIEKVACDYNKTVVAPTCEKDGYEKHECKTCGYSYSVTYSAIGHAYGAWTHNEDGTHSRVCANDKTHVESAKCDYQTVVTAPTCEEKGYTIYTCTICGHSYVGDETDALGHSWSKWTEGGDGTHSRVCGNDASHKQTDKCVYVSEVIAPTCTADGYTRYLCKICGHSYNDNFVKALDHSWSKLICNTEKDHYRFCYNCGTREDELCSFKPDRIFEASCTDQGYTYYICECGNGYKADFVEPFGHRFDRYESHNNGRHVVFCSECGVIGPDLLYCSYDANGNCVCGYHADPMFVAEKLKSDENGEYVLRYMFYAFDSGMDPLCADGLVSVVKSDTGEIVDNMYWRSDMEGIWLYMAEPHGPDPLGHDSHGRLTFAADGSLSFYDCGGSHSWGVRQAIIEATCTESGLDLRYCRYCEETREIVRQAYGHAFTYVCNGDGTHTGTCSNVIGDKQCGHTVTEECTITTKVVQATCRKEGYTTISCTVCRDTKKIDIVPKLPHSFENAECVSCGLLETYKWSGNVNRFDTEYYEEITLDLVNNTAIVIRYFANADGTPGELEGEYTMYLKTHETAYLRHMIFADADLNPESLHIVINLYPRDEKPSSIYTCKNHKYVLLEKVDPTCETDGYKLHLCTECGYTEKDIASAPGHMWGEWICNGEGIHTRVCMRDGSHVWSEGCTLDWVDVVPVSCDRDGIRNQICVSCNHVYATETIPALEHKYDENGRCYNCGNFESVAASLLFKMNQQWNSILNKYNVTEDQQARYDALVDQMKAADPENKDLLNSIYNEFKIFTNEIYNGGSTAELDSYRKEILNKMDSEWSSLNEKYSISADQQTQFSDIYSRIKAAKTVKEIDAIYSNDFNALTESVIKGGGEVDIESLRQEIRNYIMSDWRSLSKQYLVAYIYHYAWDTLRNQVNVVGTEEELRTLERAYNILRETVMMDVPMLDSQEMFESYREEVLEEIFALWENVQMRYPVASAEMAPTIDKRINSMSTAVDIYSLHNHCRSIFNYFKTIVGKDDYELSERRNSALNEMAINWEHLYNNGIAITFDQYLYYLQLRFAIELSFETYEIDEYLGEFHELVAEIEEGTDIPVDPLKKIRQEILEKIFMAWDDLHMAGYAISNEQYERFNQLIDHIHLATSEELIYDYNNQINDLINEIVKGGGTTDFEALRQDMMKWMSSEWKMAQEKFGVTDEQVKRYREIYSNVKMATTEEELDSYKDQFKMLLSDIINGGGETPSGLEDYKNDTICILDERWQIICQYYITGSEAYRAHVMMLREEIRAADSFEKVDSLKAQFYDIENRILAQGSPEVDNYREESLNYLENRWNDILLEGIKFTEAQQERFSAYHAGVKDSISPFDIESFVQKFEDLVKEIYSGIDTPVDPVENHRQNVLNTMRFVWNDFIASAPNAPTAEQAAYFDELCYRVSVAGSMEEINNIHDNIFVPFMEKLYSGSGEVDIDQYRNDLLYDINREWQRLNINGVFTNEYFDSEYANIINAIYEAFDEKQLSQLKDRFYELCDERHIRNDVFFWKNQYQERMNIEWEFLLTYFNAAALENAELYDLICQNMAKAENMEEVNDIYYSAFDNLYRSIAGESFEEEVDSIRWETISRVQKAWNLVGEQNEWWIPQLLDTHFQAFNERLHSARTVQELNALEAFLMEQILEKANEGIYLESMCEQLIRDMYVDMQYLSLDGHNVTAEHYQRADQIAMMIRNATTVADAIKIMNELYHGDLWNDIVNGNDWEAIREDILNSMRNNWENLNNRFEIAEAYVNSYRELYRRVKSAGSVEELRSLEDEICWLFREIEETNGGMGTEPEQDWIEDVWMDQNDFTVSVGTSYKHFAYENILGKTLYVRYAYKGVVEVIITEEMLQIDPEGMISFEQIGRFLGGYINYYDGSNGCNHAYYVTVLPDMSSANSLGKFQLDIQNGMELIQYVELFDNGYAYLTVENSEDFDIISYYFDEAGRLYLDDTGAIIVCTVNYEKQLITCYNAAVDMTLIGEYFYDAITFRVFGNYTGAGEYITMLEYVDASGVVRMSLTTIAYLDMERRVFACGIIGGEMQYDENGYLGCRHEYVTEYREPTCTMPGEEHTHCVNCGQGTYREIPPLGHDYDADGYCIRCGRYMGGIDTPVRIENVYITPWQITDIPVGLSMEEFMAYVKNIEFFLNINYSDGTGIAGPYDISNIDFNSLDLNAPGSQTIWIDVPIDDLTWMLSIEFYFIGEPQVIAEYQMDKSSMKYDRVGEFRSIRIISDRTLMLDDGRTVSYDRYNNVIRFVNWNYEVLVVVNDETKTFSYYQAEDLNHIGTYFFDSFNAIFVYGDYYGAGEYVAVYVEGDFQDGKLLNKTSTMTTVIFLDLESNTVYCPYYTEVTLTIGEDGWLFYAPTVCEHLFDENDYCVYCGVNRVDVVRENILSKMEEEWVQLWREGYDTNSFAGEYEEYRNRIYFSDSVSDIEVVYDKLFRTLVNHVKKQGPSSNVDESVREQYLSDMEFRWNDLLRRCEGGLPGNFYDEYFNIRNVMYATSSPSELDMYYHQFFMDLMYRAEDWWHNQMIDRVDHIIFEQREYTFTEGEITDPQQFINDYLCQSFLTVIYADGRQEMVQITPDMISYDGNVEFGTVGDFDFRISYSGRGYFWQSYITVTFLIDTSNSKLLGRYSFTLEELGEHEIMQLEIWDNGYAIMTYEGFDYFEQIPCEIRGNIICLDTGDGIWLFEIVSEDWAKLYLNIATEGLNVIGTYAFAQEFSFTVYGDYTGAGQYMALLNVTEHYDQYSIPLLVDLDLENGTIFTEHIGDMLYINSNGSLYLPGQENEIISVRLSESSMEIYENSFEGNPERFIEMYLLDKAWVITYGDGRQEYVQLTRDMISYDYDAVFDQAGTFRFHISYNTDNYGTSRTFKVFFLMRDAEVVGSYSCDMSPVGERYTLFIDIYSNGYAGITDDAGSDLQYSPCEIVGGQFILFTYEDRGPIVLKIASENEAILFDPATENYPTFATFRWDELTIDAYGEYTAPGAYLVVLRIEQYYVPIMMDIDLDAKTIVSNYFYYTMQINDDGTLTEIRDGMEDDEWGELVPVDPDISYDDDFEYDSSVGKDDVAIVEKESGDCVGTVDGEYHYASNDSGSNEYYYTYTDNGAYAYSVVAA